MKLSENYAFRLSVCALGVTAVIALAVFGGLALTAESPAQASLPPTESNLPAPPTEAETNVHRQLGAAVEAGLISRQCADSLVPIAKRCLSACFGRGSEFSLAIETNTCAVWGCVCADGTQIPALELAP